MLPARVLAGHQVDEEYLEGLLLLGRKIAFISSNNAAAGSAAAKDVAGVLEKLRIRAIVKVCGRAAAQGLSSSFSSEPSPHACTCQD